MVLNINMKILNWYSSWKNTGRKKCSFCKNSLKMKPSFSCFLSVQAICGLTVAVKSLSFCKLNFVILSAWECDYLKGKTRSLHLEHICINRLFLLSVHALCPWSHLRSLWNQGQQFWRQNNLKEKVFMAFFFLYTNLETLTSSSIYCILLCEFKNRCHFGSKKEKERKEK